MMRPGGITIMDPRPGTGPGEDSGDVVATVVLFGSRGSFAGSQGITLGEARRARDELTRLIAAADPDYCECESDEGRGACSYCMQRAEDLIGKRVRDSHGREWDVEDLDQKNGLALVSGGTYWAYLDDVELVSEVAA